MSAGANAGGVNFISNTFPGRVIIAQYGAFENVVTFRSTGYLAVRFDPPFDPPYTITNIEFPSFTFNNVPAPFLSAKFCALSQATGPARTSRIPLCQPDSVHWELRTA